MKSHHLFIIGAFALAGCGSGSSEVSFRGGGGSSQEPLRNIASFTVQGENDTVADRVLSASDTPTFQWSAVEGAVQYEIGIFENDERTVKCAPRTVGSNSYTFSGCLLEDRRTYQARIRVFDAEANELRLAISFFPFNIRKLQWGPMNPTILAGESLQMSVTYGSLPYSILDGGSGFLSIPGLLYAPPVGAGPRTENLLVQDADGNIHQTVVRTMGFADRGALGTNAIGQIFAASSGLYAAGSRVVSGDDVFTLVRSTDQGATWSVLANHHEVGENQHADGIAMDGAGALYAIGWGRFDGQAPALVVRKSTDTGATWSTIDSHAIVGAGAHVVKGFVTKSDGRSFSLIETDVGGTPIRRLRGSGVGGAAWTDLEDFPIDGAADNVTFHSFFGDASGGLWIGLSEEIGGQIGLSLYRSTDHGVTWIRRLRLDAESQMGAFREVGGQISFAGPYGIYQSSNAGLSWSHKALPAGWSNATDILRSAAGRLYLTDGRRVAVQTLDGNSWTAVDDIQLTSRTTPTLGSFVPCDDAGICLVHSHDPVTGRAMLLRVLR